MKIRLVLTAVLLVCLAATVSAEDLGPLQVLLTREEAAAWKNVKTDADAQAFVELFWARRDPTPATPRNEYREAIEERIRYADATFTKERVRGAMTDRGQVLLLYGSPKRAARVTPQRTNNADDILRRNEDSVEGAAIEWTYENDDTQAVFNAPRATLRFLDRLGNEEYKLERGRLDLAKAQERAVARTITQPALTAPPTFASETRQAAPAAAPTPAPAVTELTTEAFKAAVAEGKNRGGFATYGEFVTSYGETFVPVGLYIPKATGVTGTAATFFGVVQDASGRNVLAFEEPVTLTATKDDFFVDKTLTLPAGKHRGTFGVAQNGNVIAVAVTDMELSGSLDKDATAISRLLLSNNIYPLTAAQKATDPFAFGGVKVIPKADLTFRTSDDLWYFFELRNPGLAEATLPENVVPVNAAETPRVPKVQVKLDVLGTDREGKPVKMAAPPREIEAVEMRGVPGHYGVGNAIPLATFKPGDYTFTVKVIDTVKKTSYTLSEKFKVVE